VGGQVLAQNAPDRIEEVRGTEPVGASQLALRAVILRNAHIRTKSDWAPVLSLPIPEDLNPTDVIVEVRDSLDYGYYMKPTQPCQSDIECEFRWAIDTMKTIGIGPENLWPLARISAKPTETKYLPVCFCGSQELTGKGVIDFILVPSRAIHLTYRLQNENGKEIKSGTYQNLSPGQPITVTFDPSKDNSVKSLKLKLNHVSATDGTVERFSDSFTVIWR
jgi:hypothetical protein